MNQPNPCPNCGNIEYEPHAVKRLLSIKYQVSYYCCGFSAPHGKTKEDAVSEWNHIIDRMNIDEAA